MDTSKNHPITIQEYFERVINEKDHQYDQRFRASEIAVQAALVAQKLSVDTALAAADRAVSKAEIATDKRFDSVNGFRETLTDLQSTLMPRSETMALLKSLEDKLAVAQITYESRLEVQRLSVEKDNDAMTKEIVSLRESRAEGGGKISGISAVWGVLIAVSGVALVVIFHFWK